jgi:hypothetical protein
MMQQFAMLSTNTSACNFVPLVAQVFTQQRQNYGGQRNAGHTRGRSQGGHGCPSHAPAAGGSTIPYVPPALPGAIPFINPGIHPALQQQNPCFSNITKYWANQNVRFTCGFDVENWCNSATCPRKKPGHQDGFTCANFMEYEKNNHQFCRKVMHKTMYPTM